MSQQPKGRKSLSDERARHVAVNPTPHSGPQMPAGESKFLTATSGRGYMHGMLNLFRPRDALAFAQKLEFFWSRESGGVCTAMSPVVTRFETMTQTPYRISELPVGRTKAYQEINE